MGPSNLSLAILRRCTLPRHDYHLRVHVPEATFSLAEVFDKEIHKVLRRWCNADDEALRLASLPCKMGGLGITSTILKQRYLFAISRNSIDEQLKPTNAPVDITGERKGANHKKISSHAARTDF